MRKPETNPKQENPKQYDGLEKEREATKTELVNLEDTVDDVGSYCGTSTEDCYGKPLTKM